MRKISKLLAVVLSALLVLSGMPVLAGAENNIKVSLNGQPITFDAQPETSNDRTMVPMRAIFEAFGCDVSFDESTGTVTGTKGDMTIKLVIGNTVAIAGDKELTLDAAPYIKDDRTYVPVRFIAESLDCKVGWDETTQEVIVLNLDKLKSDLESSSEFLKYALNMPIEAAKESGLKEESNMSFTFKMSGMKDVADAAGTVNLKMNSVSSGMEGTSSGTITMDISGLVEAYKKVASANGELSEADQKLLEALSKQTELKIEAVYDKDFNFYCKAANLKELITAFAGEDAAKSISNDTWYKLNMQDYMDSVMSKTGASGISLQSLISGGSLWDGIVNMVETEDINSSNVSLMVGTMYATYTTMFGNDNMKLSKQDDGSVTYTLNIDQNTFIDMMAKSLAAQIGISVDMAKVMIEGQLSSVGLNFGLAMNMTIKEDLKTKMDMTMTLGVNNTDKEGKPDGAISFRMTADSTSEKISKEEVKVTIPTDSVDLLPLIEKWLDAALPPAA